MMYGGWQNGMGMGGWLLMALFWIVLVALIVWALTRFASSSRSESQALETPEQVLDRRLARGEIDSEAYEELRATLRGAREDNLSSR